MKVVIPLSPAPYQLLLHGRSRFIGVCHEDIAGCKQCLSAIARFLAAEMGFDVNCAITCTVDGYSSELGISATAAIELRRLTVLECFLSRPDFSGFAQRTTVEDLIIADELEVAA